MSPAKDPSVTDNARAEAWRRFPNGIDVETGEPVDDYGYPETAREAFIGGAEWAAGRAETTTDEVYEAGYKSGYHDGYPAGYGAARAETTTERRVHNHGPEDGPGLACPEKVLPDGGLRGACLARAETTTATDEDARRIVYDASGDVSMDHLTRGVMARCIVNALTDAGLLATARTRPTEPTDAQVKRAAAALMDGDPEYENGTYGPDDYEAMARAALRAAWTEAGR